MRKVIFLDVDGVLNSDATMGLSWKESLEKPLLKLLYRIVQKTNAKIVLSSNWRLQLEPRMFLHEVFQKLSTRSVHLEIIGQTAEMKHRGVKNSYGKIDHEKTAIYSRASEIKAYVEKNSFKAKGVKWIVIDDMNLDLDDDLKSKFIKTEPTLGLTAKNVVDAISKLNY